MQIRLRVGTRRGRIARMRDCMVICDHLSGPCLERIIVLLVSVEAVHELRGGATEDELEYSSTLFYMHGQCKQRTPEKRVFSLYRSRGVVKWEKN